MGVEEDDDDEEPAKKKLNIANNPSFHLPNALQT